METYGENIVILGDCIITKFLRIQKIVNFLNKFLKIEGFVPEKSYDAMDKRNLITLSYAKEQINLTVTTHPI